jgi:hypothetical protein
VSLKFVFVELAGADEVAAAARTDPVVIPAFGIEDELAVQPVVFELFERCSAMPANVR